MDADYKSRKRRKALRIALGVLAGVLSFALGGAFVLALFVALGFATVFGSAHVSGTVSNGLLFSLAPLILAGAGLLGYSIATSAKRLTIVSIVIWVITIGEIAAFVWMLRALST